MPWEVALEKAKRQKKTKNKKTTPLQIVTAIKLPTICITEVKVSPLLSRLLLKKQPP